MPDERDQVFARDVLNASLTLMSILVAVITFLAVEYKRVQTDATLAEPIRKAVWGTTEVSVFAGALALVALIQLRSGRCSTSPLAWAFGGLITILMLGIEYLVWELMA
jgi:hypothetical protein